MKHLKSFSPLNESNRFLHMKEVLDTLEELSFDFTDCGFETKFGIMSQQTLHNPDFAFFDEYLDDIQIKWSSIGKSIIYFKLDLINMKDQYGGKLESDELDVLESTIKSIDSYLKSEDMLISGFWVKYMPKREKYVFKRFNTPEELLRFIEECNDKHHPLANHVLDVRVAFRGQPLLDESNTFDTVQMKHLKSFNESLDEKYNELFLVLYGKSVMKEYNELIEDIKDRCYDLKDLGFDVDIDWTYSTKHRMDRYPKLQITISGVSELFDQYYEKEVSPVIESIRQLSRDLGYSSGGGFTENYSRSIYGKYNILIQK